MGSVEEFGDLTSEDVSRLDAAAARMRCHARLQLMEIAGWQVARCAWQHVGRPRWILRLWPAMATTEATASSPRATSPRGAAPSEPWLSQRSRACRVIVLEHVVAARACGVDVIVTAATEAAITIATVLRWSSTRSSARACAARPATLGARAIRELNSRRRSDPERRCAERPRRHQRRGIRSVRTRLRDLHPDRDEARPAKQRAPPRTRARSGSPTSACRRRRGSAPVCTSHPASPVGSWCTLRPDLPLTAERTPRCILRSTDRAVCANVMINVSAHIAPEARELAATVREQLDDLVTYATHLVNHQADAVAFVAGGIHHASRYPPTRLRVDGRAALYRAVTRSMPARAALPTETRGDRPDVPSQRRLGPGRGRHGRRRSHQHRQARDGDARLRSPCGAPASRPVRAGLPRDGSRALECSPEAAARLVAAARREFGSIYREIAL